MSLNVQTFPVGSGPGSSTSPGSIPDPTSAPTPPSSLTNKSPISNSVALSPSSTIKPQPPNLHNHQQHQYQHIHTSPPGLGSPVPETPPGSPPLDPVNEPDSVLMSATKSISSHPVSNNNDNDTTATTQTIPTATITTNAALNGNGSCTEVDKENKSVNNPSSASASELSSAASSSSSATSVGSQPEIFSLHLPTPDNLSEKDQNITPANNSPTSSATATPTAIPSRRSSPSQKAIPEPAFPIAATDPVNTTSSNTPSNKTSSHSTATTDADVSSEPTLLSTIPFSLSSYPSEHPLYTSQNLSNIVTSNPPVFAISAQTLALAIDYHYSSLLPEIDNVFPWLHGLHQNNVSQRMFFQPARKANSNYFAIPNFDSLQDSESAFNIPTTVRGFLVLKVGPANSQGTLIGSVYPDEILARKSTDADFDMEDFSFNDSMAASLDNFGFSLEGDSDNNDNADNEVDSSLNPENYASKFLDVDPVEGISLRNFHIQVAKWSTISDIALYVSDEALRPKMLKFALLISRAQETLRQNNPGLPQYSTFVVQDPIDKFLQESRHIMAIPPVGTPYNEDQIKMRNWDSNFLLHENVEMSMMSSASPIGGEQGNLSRVWLGNVSDYESHLEVVWDYIWNGDKKHKQDIVNSNDLSSNAGDYAYDIDMDSDNNSTESPLQKALKTNWTLYVRCKPGAQMPSLSVIDDQIRKTLAGDLDNAPCPTTEDDSAAHSAGTNKWHKTIIEFPSSGTITAGTLTESDVYSIISVCKLLYVRGRGMHKGRQTSSLIFSVDGYTESSFLALCYAIYSKGLTAPEAWIYIHKHCYRPIFSFPTDPQLVFKLQKALLRYSPAVPGSLYDENYGAVYNIDTPPEPRVGNTYHSEETKNNCIADRSSIKRGGEVIFEEDPHPPAITIDQLSVDDQWFATFDGSFPSLILQHMYLGSLAHANNVQMLTRLGIKRVISVGEPLSWVNYNTRNNGEDTYMAGMDDLGDLEGKNVQVVEKPYPGISKVLYIRGVQDDGIDSLTEFLWACLDFLDEGEQAKEPTLVHCRVGVSRSATVCIAEVMKRLSVGLPRAYLFVRVRRLNVIIQPHLRFMFELAKWEERHRRSGKGWLREVDWPILCREISIMNRAYIPG